MKSHHPPSPAVVDQSAERLEPSEVGGGPARRIRGRSRVLSSQAIARMIRGAREGGFEPGEIVIEATGEVRLMAATTPTQRRGRPNDFESEFG